MKLIDFYGRECPHCQRMMPLVDRLVEENEVEIEKLEVWHDEANAEKMNQFRNEIIEACGGAYGVPVLVEPLDRKVLCGEVDYHTLHSWYESVKK